MRNMDIIIERVRIIDGSGAPISVKRKFPAWDALFRRYAEESR